MGAWERTLGSRRIIYKYNGLPTLEGYLLVSNQYGVKIMASTACQPVGTDIFNSKNRKQCEKYVRSIQRKLDEAVADNDKEKIRWYIHLLSKRSRAVKVLAVYHVTAENKGRYTAGVDGIRMLRGRKGINEQTRLSLFNAINIKKRPSPIRRVFIPKPNGKKRPLGITTIADRIIQDILRIAIEPITEYHASDNSYGFRPKRSCHDAIDHLYRKLSQRYAKQWVIEGDIAG
ncbi:MAG: reverse transcriptase domain-containing protein, partial [Candidatus Poribacteria bacterium]